MPQTLGFDLPALAGSLITKIWMLQRTFNWQVILPDNVGSIPGLLVSQYCQDIRFGDYSITEISAMRHGSDQRFYAGLRDIEQVPMTFVMPVDNAVHEYFQNWRNLMVDSDGYFYPKSNYARDIYVFLFDRSGVQSAKFVLKGCFPRTCPPLTLSYTEDSVLKWNIDLFVDYIEESSLLGSVRSAVLGVIGGAVNAVKSTFGG